MKKALVVALITTVAFMGCNKKSEEGGRAGNDTFKVVVPAMSTAVKQGEFQNVKVSIERGAGFQQAVKLEMKAPAGAGLQFDPSSTTIKPGDNGEVQLKITAAKDAPITDQKILIKGTPDKGDSAEVEFTVTVKAAGNDTFKLAVPLLATAVKQGEVQTIKVSIDRDNGYQQAVKLEVKAPTGLKIDPESATIKPGDKGEVQLTITAAKDAPLGDQKVIIKGTPDKGQTMEKEYTITVKAP